MKEGLSTQQKEADKDLNILALFTLLPLMGFLAFQEPIINFTRSPDHSLWIRLIVLALCQFSVAGLGTSAVLIRRKESIQKYGLVKKKFFPTILQTVLIALPLLIFLIASGQMHSYLPFQSILLTKEVLSSPFPTNFLGYLLISLIWGFWEGFNYVVIVRKINLRYPQYVKGVWNLGALTRRNCFHSYLWNASSSETYRKRLGLYSYFCPPLECLLISSKQDQTSLVFTREVFLRVTF